MVNHPQSNTEWETRFSDGMEGWVMSVNRVYKNLESKVYWGKENLGSLVNFKTATHQTKQTSDYIHLDLWDPAKVNSHGGVKYFLTIIDDYSRNVWLYIC